MTTSAVRGPSYIYPVTGVRTGQDPTTKKWPVRRELDDFLTDPKQTLLFFSALSVLQARPMDDTLSYFQICGIHGLPELTWPRRGGPETGYYCFHGRAAFTTWHRVYLALYEQVLHDIIIGFISPYTPEGDSPVPVADRSEWVQAAETWRLPYWDFARRRTYNNNNTCIPRAAMDETDPLVETTPQVLGAKTQQQLPGMPILQPGLPGLGGTNPLYAFRYNLPPGKKLTDYGIGSDFGLQERTVRHAYRYRPTDPPKTQATWIQGISDITNLKRIFSEKTVSWRKDFRSTLKNTTTFDQFVEGIRPPGGSVFAPRLPTLEGLHGDVHVATGGATDPTRNGNMSGLSTAGFDPLFMLWHCCVDRAFALWQAGHPDTTNPNNWMVSDNPRDPLYPFRKSATTQSYWNSNDVRNTSALGYSYSVQDEVFNAATLATVCDRLYADNIFFGGQPSRGVKDGKPLPELVAPPDYVFTAIFEINEIGPFRIVINLDVNGTIHELGNIVNLVAAREIECANCERQQREHVTLPRSTIITPALRALYERRVIPSFIPERVERLLAEGLTWELVTIDGEPIPIESLTSLKVEVTKGDREVEVGLPGFRSPSRPVGSRPPNNIPLRGITDGKPGGLGEGEEAPA